MYGALPRWTHTPLVIASLWAYITLAMWAVASARPNGLPIPVWLAGILLTIALIVIELVVLALSSHSDR